MMFKEAKLLKEKERTRCSACQDLINDKDPETFVSFEEDLFRKTVFKPLVVLFLHSEDHHQSTDKICLDCFTKLQRISEFYNKCKNSRGKLRSSSGTPPRILSTETPDLTSESQTGPSSNLVSSSSSSGSVHNPPQLTHQERQLSLPKEKKDYKIHYDLGIRLPKPIINKRGCFDADDLCYLMLKDEFERENAKDQEAAVSSASNSCENKLSFVAPQKAIEHKQGHTHITSCPFCPALIERKHPQF